MKAFKGYEDAKKNADYQGIGKLPAGAYICTIKNVKYEEGTDSKNAAIAIMFDIAEGEYKEFFQKQFEANTNEDKKFKGSTRIWVPSDDGSEKDGWTKNSFAKWMKAFEDSNSKFTWNWDETKLKGLSVGIVFGETGTVIDSRDVVYTEPRFACAVELVKNGKAPKAKFVSKNGYPSGSSSSASAPQTDEDGFLNVTSGEDIPF